MSDGLRQALEAEATVLDTLDDRMAPYAAELDPKGLARKLRAMLAANPTDPLRSELAAYGKHLLADYAEGKRIPITRVISDLDAMLARDNDRKWYKAINPTDAPAPGLVTALGAIEKAHEVVSKLCMGTLRWTMSVPADEENDPDLVITNALMMAKRALAAYPTDAAQRRGDFVACLKWIANLDYFPTPEQAGAEAARRFKEGR